jgi:hypothetical protein
MTYLPFQAFSGHNANRINHLRKDGFRNSGMGQAHDELRASPAELFFFGTFFSFAKYKKKSENG